LRERRMLQMKKYRKRVRLTEADKVKIVIKFR